ncbi:hypothetical protein COBT_001777 [Conglomerata obtusa]
MTECTNNHSKTIEQLLTTLDIFKVFKYIDINSTEIILDVKTTNVIKKAIHMQKINDCFAIIDVDEIINKLFKNQITINIETFIEAFFTIEIKNYTIIRDVFGYAQIFTYLKIVINTLFNETFHYKAIGLLYRLIDNPQLCYKTIYPVICKLNLYIDRKCFDNNLQTCCMVIKAMIIYEPRILKDKNDFLKSLLLYLFQTIPKSLNHNDPIYMCNLIKHIIKFLPIKSVKNLLFGMYKELVEWLQSFDSFVICVFEEQVLLKNILYLLNIIALGANNAGVCMLNIQKLQIQKFNIKRSNHVTDAEWQNLYTKLIKYKYRALSNLIKDEMQFDTKLFIREISKCKKQPEILNHCTKLVKYLNLDLFKIYALNEQMNTVQYIFAHCLPQMICIELPIEFIKNINDPKILLLATHLYIKNNKCCSKMLALLYAKSLASNCTSNSKVQKVIHEYYTYNPNFQEFLVNLFKNIDELDEKLLLLLVYGSYALQNVKFIINYIDKYKKTKANKFYIYEAVIRDKLKVLPIVSNFNDLVIYLLVCIENKTLVSIVELQKIVLDFVFNISEMQFKPIKHLYLIYLGSENVCEVYQKFKDVKNNCAQINQQ